MSGPSNARAELEATLQRLAHLLRQGASRDAAAVASSARQAFPLSGELVRLHGIALLQLGHRQDGLTALHRAAELAPDSIEVQCDLANVALEDGRPEAAIERLHAALARHPGHPVMGQLLGVALMAAGRHEEARETFARAIGAAPQHPGLRLNLAETELELGDAAQALAHVREALALAPRMDAAHALLGQVLQFQGRSAEAARAWLEAERLAPRQPRHAFQAGRMLEDAGQLADAAGAYARALQLAPNSGAALSRLAYVRRWLADWREQAALTARLRDGINAGMHGIAPFVLPLEPFDRALQRRAMEHFTGPIDQHLAALRQKLAFAPPRPAPDAAIRVGLLSDGLGEHPVGHALVGLVEALATLGGLDLHLFATTPDDGGPIRKRLAAAAHLHALDALPLPQVAEHIHAHGIEVLLDLAGHGTHTTVDILALRPAPVQVNWLAYPGTAGAPWIDYILADTVVLPPAHRADYSEKVLRLPRCFLPVASTTTAPPPTRAECGLPATGTVFACFNETAAINPESFARFMLVLREVPGSVLWLRTGPAGADERLRAAAAELDVAPERLVFLPALSHADVLARHAVADLCLDTLPCGARTEAADALWAGCPVLTCAGDTFAGRIGSSLLHHAHLPELVAEDPDAFVAMAVQLGSDPAALTAIRRHLADLRTQSPLFDVAGFAADFRRVVQTIGTRHRIGRPPIDLDF
ncbi:MAG TPA: tetratricopeptide repeat protein [Frateuria sp.]|uniref:O-linked N-acetylglucosamine transferase, SPINDLY family protein n=1 Tax=Frateuria sp. TaxID=2211372 RepID=UPI002D7F1750|nr:tetratricopeptide repeat protein [Frateuria sp.]HET6804023.1 tetratricopeptide repeat protein [Frateuria sp.]